MRPYHGEEKKKPSQRKETDWSGSSGKNACLARVEALSSNLHATKKREGEKKCVFNLQQKEYARMFVLVIFLILKNGSNSNFY
jgi:hypothetical protein